MVTQPAALEQVHTSMLVLHINMPLCRLLFTRVSSFTIGRRVNHVSRHVSSKHQLRNTKGAYKCCLDYEKTCIQYGGLPSDHASGVPM